MNNEQNLIQQASSAKFISKLYLATFLVFINIIGCQKLHSVILQKIQIGFLLNDQNILGTAISVFIEFGLMLAALAAWVLLVEKRSFMTLGLRSSQSLLKFSRGCLYAGLLSIIIYIILIFIGQLKIESASNISLSLIFSVFLMFIVFCFQGGTEELLFRGWLLPILGNSGSIKSAILFSSFLFGYIHVRLNGIKFLLEHGRTYTNSLIVFILFVNIVMYSILISIICLREKSIYTVIGIHGTWNWFQTSVFGSPVSGVIFNENSIFSVKMSGANLLSGGEIGIEASIITSIVLITLLYWQKKTIAT